MDAYTLRKIAPRILISVVGINLSIYLCVAAISVTNVIGSGLGALIAGPFSTNGIHLDGGSANLGAIISVLSTLIVGSIYLLGAGAGGGPLGVLFIFILTVVLIVLSIMITLVFRQALIVLLTVFSPVAVALFILPGTEKYFRQWWDLFLKTLLVYPIIAALFAVSGALATINFESTNLGSNTQGAFKVITGLILVFIPLFLIPFAFKFSGGIIGGVSGAADGMRRRFVGANQERLARSGKDPNSALSRGNRTVRASVSSAQFNARRRIAGSRFNPRDRISNRFGRVRGSRDVLEGLNAQEEIANAALNAEASQTHAAKVASQIDEAQMDMAKYGSGAESRAAIQDGTHFSFNPEHRDIAQRIASGQTVTDEERVSLEERQGQLTMYSHMNDRVGRSMATRAAAAKSAPALSFGYAGSQEGWDQAVDIARDIFDGDETRMMNHLNEVQYVASQVGRSDLSGNVNSLTYDPLRAGEKVSGAQVMSSSKPAAVTSIAKEQVKILRSSSRSYKEKLRASKILASLRAGSSGPYATDGNKKALGDQEKNIDDAVAEFMDDPRMQIEATRAEASEDPQLYAENIFKPQSVQTPNSRTVEVEPGVETTEPIYETVEGSKAGQRWFMQQSNKQISRSDEDAQRRQQEQAQDEN